MAFQEWHAFYNHLCLSFLRSPSWFPSDHLLTHKLAPLWGLWDLNLFHSSPSGCHDTDGRMMLPTKRWKCTSVQELGRTEQVSATPDWLLSGLSTYPTALWVCWTRKVGKLRVLNHQSLSIFHLHGHRPVSALGQSSPSLGSLWMAVGPRLLQSALFGLPDAGDLEIRLSVKGTRAGRITWICISSMAFVIKRSLKSCPYNCLYGPLLSRGAGQIEGIKEFTGALLWRLG